MIARRMMRALLCLIVSVPVAAFAAAESGNGSFSADQAARGAKVYADNCASCHGGAMEGADVTPPLTGPRFLSNWSSQSVGALVQRIHTTMPQDSPGSLGMGATRDVAAHILAENGFAAGGAELPTDPAALDAVKIGTPPAK